MSRSEGRHPGAPLTEAQRAAIAHVRGQAEAERPAARAALIAAGHDPAALIDQVVAGARVTLNFHPDRLLADGRSVAAALATEGTYRSQFESAISSGSLTAFPGGERDRWEARLFGGAYQRAGVGARERPRYGGLDLLRHGDGACPRFGSCHLVLGRAALDRATLCLGDSHLGPRWVGTVDALEPVLAARLAGMPGPAIAAMLAGLAAPVEAGDPARPPGRALDDYIEVQLHGDLELARDAEALIVDPSFRGTACGATLTAIAAAAGLRLAWHRGFTLAVAAVPSDFRGPAMPGLAARVLRDHAPRGVERIDAALLGAAAAAIVRGEVDPSVWGDRAAALQRIKELWHLLVAFGEAAAIA